MKHLIFGFLVMSASIVHVGAITRPHQAAGAQDEQQLDEAAKKLTERVCAECHDIGMAIDSRRTPKDWKTVVTQMAQQGANATDDEFAAITKYLTRHHGVAQVRVIMVQHNRMAVPGEHRTGPAENT